MLWTIAQTPAAPSIPAAPATPTAEAPVTQAPSTAAPGGTTLAPSGKEPAPGILSGPLVPMIIIIAVMYFFLFRSKKTQQKKLASMLDALKKGDRVQTIGGIRGAVVEARDEEVVIKVDESSNAKITFARSAIHKVLEEEKK